MSSSDLQIPKLYYSIGEVSEMTGLKQYVLRYWETEFPTLKPQKNRAGNRIYRQKDIDEILKIKKLLYEEKFTIKGARNQLRLERARASKAESQKQGEAVETNERYRELLKTVKKELLEILDILNRY